MSLWGASMAVLVDATLHVAEVVKVVAMEVVKMHVMVANTPALVDVRIVVVELVNIQVAVKYYLLKNNSSNMKIQWMII